MIKDLKASDPVSVGPYRLLGRLGAGGMGMVYLAKSPGGRLVAIKLIRPELAEEKGFRTRFAGEIAAARNVSGIYTAAVVDADSDAELPWMATVYVPGPSLTDAVEDSGPLPVQSVLALAAGLAEALEAIHRAGLVHRDLKPSNVLLASDGPRVIDFGISRALEGAMMTTTGMVLGSPGFMSPEQAMGEQVGQPSDVFSLGAILAFASTGKSPFGTGPTPALLYRVVKEQPDLTQVPDQVRPLIEQCLAKDPASRPTPADLLASLSDDVAAMTGEWLPQTIADAMGRYSPTLSTPLPPPFREPDSVPPGAGVAGAVAAGAGAAAAGAALAGAPATDAAGPPAAGTPAPPPAGRTSGPLTVVAAAPGAAAPVPADATVVDHGLLPETALVAVTGGQGVSRVTGGQGIPGGIGPSGPSAPSGPPGPRRRRRWPVLVAAAVLVVVAAVAALALTRSPGKGKVGPEATASLAGDATRAPASSASAAASRTLARKPSPTATGYTQPSSSGGYTSSPTATQSLSPTATASWSPTPTTKPTPTATTTTSATPTTSPTPTQTTPTSSPTPTVAPTLSSPTAAAPTSTP